METQLIFNVLIGLVAALGGWWMNNLKDVLKGHQENHKELSSKVSNIELLVAGQYVTRDELARNMDKIFSKLDNITAMVSEKADRA